MAERENAEVEPYRLEMDHDWSLVEISSFGRQYTQLYSLFYSLRYRARVQEAVVEDDEDEGFDFDDDRARRVYRTYPWRGGYSAVNFYQSLYYQVPKRHRPQIVRIAYASPGFVELALVEIVARSIRRTVKVICDSFLAVNGAYNEIYKGIQDRKLMRINVRREELALSREQEDFAEESLTRFSSELKFEHVPELRQLAGSNVAALKILLSVYRRARELAKLQMQNKMKF
jgi:hypothetical protein